MEKRRVVRKKLSVTNKVDVIHIAPRKDMAVDLGPAGIMDASWFASVNQSEELVAELSIYMRGKRRPRNTVNLIFRYFRFVLEADKNINMASMRQFRDFLDRDEATSPNTKSQLFGAVTAFLRSAMVSGVLPVEELPKNFRGTVKTPKKSFSDACRVEIPSLFGPADASVAAAIRDYSIDEDAARSLIFSKKCMNEVRSASETVVLRTIGDWKLAKKHFDSFGEADLNKMREINFREVDNKTIKLAFGILYANFGCGLPAAKHWPPGISDWCKGQAGWPISRVCGAFFPTLKTLDAFLVLLLADEELALNVDSAAMYSYLDSCSASDKDSLFDVTFGKHRGKAVVKCLRSDNPVVIAMTALSEKIKFALQSLPCGPELLRTEQVPLMLHWTSAGAALTKGSDKLGPRPISPEMTSYMVRRFLKNNAKGEPFLTALVGKVTGEQFRPTHALIKSLSGQSVDKIRRDLNHSNLSTTRSYVDRVETEALLKTKHLSFQKFLIDAVVESRRTGSGYVCSNPAEDGCVRHAECHTCDAKRIVLKSPEIVAEWMAMQQHIVSHRAVLEADNPERWEGYWQPRLVEYDALIELCGAKARKEAEDLVHNVPLPWLS